MKKDKKKNSKKKVDELISVEAATERDLQTTHALTTRSINMMLSQGIKDSREKGGDPNVDINPKAVEFAIKWCNTNNVKFKESSEEAEFEEAVMANISKEQRAKFAKH